MEGVVATRPPMHLSGHCVCTSDPQFVEEKGIRAEDLVIGALESAFQECVSVGFAWGRVQGPEGYPCPQQWFPGIFALGGQDGVGLLVVIIAIIISPPIYPVVWYAPGAFPCPIPHAPLWSFLVQGWLSLPQF